MTAGAALRAEVRGSARDPELADAVRERARALGLLGWVREDDDGVLRVHGEGEPDAVRDLHAFLRDAPGVEDVAGLPAKVEGHEQFAVRGVPAGAFVVQEHAGGFDLHLEVGDQLVSWRLRKRPSMDPADKRMAIQTPASELPPDAAVWDSGPYEQGGRVAWPEALERGHAVFVLHGDRLSGGFALQRTRGAQWLLIKRRDAAASSRS